ncbi:hypothetical protein BDV3_004521 [Batrachochytrium dendrobatidis]|nr:hypothetical protein BDEG_22992 [Batrachochytrium dendrobatidis JEL423]
MAQLKSQTDKHQSSVSNKKDAQSIGSKKAKKPALRKGTKAWRKNVDISEMEQDLDDIRAQERLGGRVTEMPSESLFFTDTKGDQNIRKELRLKPLYMDQLLKSDSAIPGLLSRRFIKKTTKVVDPDGQLTTKSCVVSKSAAKKIETLAKRKKGLGLSIGSDAEKKEAERRKQQDMVQRAKGGFDLWGSDAVQSNAVKDKYLARTLPPYIAKYTTSDYRPKLIPAVRISHPGTSYNPKGDDHQAAILIAADIEFKKIAQEEEAEKQLSYPKELDLLDDNDYFDDTDDEEDSQAEDSAAEGETAETLQDEAAAKKKNPARKTQNQRSRRARHIEYKRRLKMQHERNEFFEQINGVDAINESMEKQAEAMQLNQAKRQALRETLKETKPARVGKYSFQAAPFEIQLKDELSGSLRTLKPEGNIFRDRFKSLQERNIIEAYVPVTKKRRYQPKFTESHDYKRFK